MELFKQVRNFDRYVIYFLLSTSFVGLSNGIFDAIYNFSLELKGIDKIGMGYIYSIAMFMMSIAIIPLLIVSKGKASHRLLFWASVVYAIPFALIPLSSTVIFNSLWLGIISSGMISILSLGNSLFGNYVKTEQRTSLFSMMLISYLGSAMIGSFIAAFITKYSSLEPATNYNLLLYISFSFAIFMCILRWISKNNISNNSLKQDRNIDIFVNKNKLPFINLILLTIGAMLIGASITLIFRFSNLLFYMSFNLDVSEISNILGFEKLISILGAIFAPSIIKKVSIKKALILLGIISFIVIFSQSLTTSLIIFITLYLVRLLLNYSITPLMDTISITYFYKDISLLSNGIRQSAFYIGSAISAIVYGNLLNNGLWKESLILSAALVFLGTVVLSIIKPQKQASINNVK